jgi:hypothetical protein
MAQINYVSYSDYRKRSHRSEPVAGLETNGHTHITNFFGTDYQKMILRENAYLREKLARDIANCVFDDHQIILRIRTKDRQTYLDCIVNTNDGFDFQDLVCLPKGGYLPIEDYQNEAGYEITTFKITCAAEEV